MDLRTRLEQRLPDSVMEHVITSFDIVGDIAIIKVPDEIAEYRTEIADAVLEQHRNVNTVIRKASERGGEFRTADYELLRGDSTETIYKEHGCRFALDPTTVYFSERLGHERERIMDMVTAGEVVVDMFAGVGPFSVLIGKHCLPQQVYAFEKNPAAADYLQQNIRLNKIDDLVTGIQGDVAETLPETGVQADRILMNLPEASERFIGTALQHIKPGGIIHYYTFVAKDTLEEGADDEIRALFADHGVDVRVDHTEICGHYNPAVERVCFDLTVTQL